MKFTWPLIGNRDATNAAIWRPVALDVFMALNSKKTLAAKIYC